MRKRGPYGPILSAFGKRLLASFYSCRLLYFHFTRYIKHWSVLILNMQTRYGLLIKNVTSNKLKKYKGELPNLLFHYENSHTRNVYSV